MTSCDKILDLSHQTPSTRSMRGRLGDETNMFPAVKLLIAWSTTKVIADCLSVRQLIMHLKLPCVCMSVRPSVHPSQLKGRLVMIPMGLNSKWDLFLSITTFPFCDNFLCVVQLTCTYCTRRHNNYTKHRGNVSNAVLGYKYFQSYSLHEAISCVYV